QGPWRGDPQGLGRLRRRAERARPPRVPGATLLRAGPVGREDRPLRRAAGAARGTDAGDPHRDPTGREAARGGPPGRAHDPAPGDGRAVSPAGAGAEGPEREGVALGWALAAACVLYALAIHHGIGPGPKGVALHWYEPRGYLLRWGWLGW